MRLGIRVRVDSAPIHSRSRQEKLIHPQSTHSTNFNLNTGVAFLASSGAQNFIGAGHASYVGCTFLRTFGQVAAYGLGGSICHDVGDLEIIGSPTAVVAGISGTAMLSLQNFMAGACLRAADCCDALGVCMSDETPVPTILSSILKHAHTQPAS